MSKNFAYLSILLCIFSACQKDTFNEYYERPASLANPIYQQLQAKGNFNSFLSLIDKAGYKDILNAAGYWTVFAPNDNAFNAYLSAHHIQNVSAIEATEARRLVEYALVFNAFKTDHIADYQSNLGWVTNAAFRRRTAYYDFVYSGEIKGISSKLLAANRNGSYVAADNNNKYLTYFFSGYFDAQKLTAADYNYFFPNATYTGFNVLNAAVVNKDIVGENGVIHETDQVLSPLSSIDQYLTAHAEYSEFKKLLDTYKVSYAPNAEATTRYQALTGSADQVNIKLYDVSLAFSPNNENYLKLQDNDGQANSWTLFAPTNAALLAYEQNVLLKHYATKTINQLPLEVITDFLNAHFWQSAVWPSKFKTTTNYLNEEARFDPATDITDQQVLSNGFFYGTRKVQEANVFHSVYGQAYLDPQYTLFKRALDLERKLTIINPNLKFALFLISDAVLRSYGFDWNTPNNTFEYTASGGTKVIGTDAVNRLKRIVNTHIVPLTASGLDISEEQLAETIGGEVIKLKNGEVYSSGTSDRTSVNEQSVALSSKVEANNGVSYAADGLLDFSSLNIGKHIEKYGNTASAPYYSFYQFLKNATTIYNSSTGEISGVVTGTFYTVLIPTDAAIQQAVTDGVLPKLASGLPNYAPTAAADVNLVLNFIRHHLINNAIIIADGNKDGNFETLLNDAAGYPVTVKVTNVNRVLSFQDKQNFTSTVTGPANSNLSNRTVLHQINSYLRP
ncbi:fasciclin domain-containing protein [Pedobacter sp. AW31-3R]|uniref:fasciclin domain-containing protein n=1 Tax=Pedobacter sp. AW31-3R TaxID=3445781 RepID=UPI003FA15330